MELISVNVSKRTKWDRSKGKKLSKKIWVARCIYLDENGKRREKTKEARTEAEAKDFQREFEAQFKRSGGRELEAARMTFNELADYYEKHFAKAAEYIGDRKVAGLRSVAAVKTYLSVLREHFGHRKLKTITYGHLRDFRALRLKTPTVHGKQRSIGAVNRELACLRRMLNVAQSEGWIPKNPFGNGAALIHTADESKRQRILSVAEEKRLLAAAEAGEGLFLKEIIICALDTGMRLGEILKLVWADVDFETDSIFVKAYNTKTATPKTVPMTARLRAALKTVLAVRLIDETRQIRADWDAMREDSHLSDNRHISISKYIAPDIENDKGEIDDKLVFGIKSNVKRSWATARRKTGLEDLRFHDLRHTTGTRLDRQGLSQAAIARALGHQQTSTTYRYINSDAESLQIVRQAMESYHLPANDDALQESDAVN
jgi:integrase